MKPYAFLMLLALAAFGFTSCQKEETADIGDAYYDAVEMQYLVNGIEEAEDEELGQIFYTPELETRDRCVEITTEEPRGVFPNTITMTFDNCPGRNGHERTGKIIVTISAPLYEVGAVKTTTFVDFFIDGVQVNGTKSVTTVAVDPDGNLTLHRTSSIEFIFEGEIKASWSVDHTMVQTGGADTKFRYDDSWEITGTATGFNARNGAFEVSIVEALIKAADCPWIVSGVKEVKTENGTFMVDFGDGTCDREATVIMPDGTSKTILLGRRR